MIISPLKYAENAYQLQDSIITSTLEREVPITVTNATQEPMEIPINTLIGTAEYLDPNEHSLLVLNDACNFIHDHDTLKNVLQGSREGDPPMPTPMVPDIGEKSPYDFDAITTPKITDTQRKELITLIKKYSHIFSKNELDPGLTTWMTHKIDTSDHEPVFEKYRPTPYKYQEEVKRHLDIMLESGVIEPASLSP